MLSFLNSPNVRNVYNMLLSEKHKPYQTDDFEMILEKRNTDSEWMYLALWTTDPIKSRYFPKTG